MLLAELVRREMRRRDQRRRLQRAVGLCCHRVSVSVGCGFAQSVKGVEPVLPRATTSAPRAFQVAARRLRVPGFLPSGASSLNRNVSHLRHVFLNQSARGKPGADGVAHATASAAKRSPHLIRALALPTGRKFAVRNFPCSPVRDPARSQVSPNAHWSLARWSFRRWGLVVPALGVGRSGAGPSSFVFPPVRGDRGFALGRRIEAALTVSQVRQRHARGEMSRDR